MKNRALELLLSDANLGGKEAHAIFYQYLREFRESDEAASAVFDIAVQILKPQSLENMNLERLDRKIQQSLILNAIEEGDKDSVMDDYIRQLAELERISEQTQNQIGDTTDTYTNFQSGVKSLEKHEPEFDFKIVKGGQDANGNQLPDTFVWSVKDSLADFNESGQILEMDITKTGFEVLKNGVVAKYLKRRPRLLDLRKEKLEQKITQLNKKNKSNEGEKFSTGAREKEYSNFKKGNTARHADAQDKTITSMRADLRKKFYKKPLTSDEKGI